MILGLGGCTSDVCKITAGSVCMYVCACDREREGWSAWIEKNVYILLDLFIVVALGSSPVYMILPCGQYTGLVHYLPPTNRKQKSSQRIDSLSPCPPITYFSTSLIATSVCSHIYGSPPPTIPIFRRIWCIWSNKSSARCHTWIRLGSFSFMYF